MVAVGLASGEVALYRLSGPPPDGKPMRLISLADWGYEPEVTGSVADLQWSPDNRALAVQPLLGALQGPGMRNVINLLVLVHMHRRPRGLAAQGSLQDCAAQNDMD